MDKPSTSNAGKSVKAELDNFKDSSSLSQNIILNHDFSGGLISWQPNYSIVNAYVVSEETGYPNRLSPNLRGRFAVITNRKEHWQGLEQDITNKVSAGSTYAVCACVGISGAPQSVYDVLATLKLEFPNSPVRYLFIGRTCASVDRWEKVEGTFCLSTMPQRVSFYLEGPLSGIDLLIRSVVVSCHTSSPRDRYVAQALSSRYGFERRVMESHALAFDYFQRVLDAQNELLKAIDNGLFVHNDSLPIFPQRLPNPFRLDTLQADPRREPMASRDGDYKVLLWMEDKLNIFWYDLLGSKFGMNTFLRQLS